MEELSDPQMGGVLMQQEKLLAWVYSPVLDDVFVEASRLYPKETGGVFMGYWSKQQDAVVITKLIGPGPDALHRRTKFRHNLHKMKNLYL